MRREPDFLHADEVRLDQSGLGACLRFSTGERPALRGPPSTKLVGCIRQSKFGNALTQQVVEFEHPAFELRQGSRLVAAGCQTALYPATEPLIFVVHLRVDARAQVADRAHFAAL